MLPLLGVLASALVLQQSYPAADTAAWGKQVDGLQLSVAIVRGEGVSTIRITVRNISDKPLLLPLGEMINATSYPSKIRVVVTTPGQQFDFRLMPIVFVAGRIHSLPIPMLPNSSYAIEMPVTGFFRGDGTVLPMELPRLVDQPGQLWAEWEVTPVKTAVPVLSNCPLLDGRNPNLLPCWESKMVSNSLTLP